MLAWGLAVLLLSEGLALVLLTGAAARARLAGDRRAAQEAEFALGSAIARVRVEGDSLLGRLGAGEARRIPAPDLPGWLVEATAARDPVGVLVELEVVVRREANDGRGDLVRSGTLLLRIGPADTALVTEDRPAY